MKNIKEQHTGNVINADSHVYCKATIKSIKNKEADKKLIANVKKAKSDLAISKILIEADEYDILVDVFSSKDAQAAVFNYTKNLYDAVLKKCKSDCKKVEFDMDDATNLDEKLEKFHQTTTAAFNEITKVNNKIDKVILKKYSDANQRKIENLKEEINLCIAKEDQLPKQLKNNSD